MTKVAKIINAFYNSKAGQKMANPAATAATAALIATVSNVSKDAVNCAYYTYQSLNNERIPEGQRKFVAALDLSNGILNVGIQILMAFGISDMIISLFDDKIAKHKDFLVTDEIIDKKFNNLTKELKAKITKEEFAKGYKEYIGNCTKLARTGFTVLAVNIAMQILTKRIITPLIATPMASGFKKKFEESEAKKAEQEKKVVANA